MRERQAGQGRERGAGKAAALALALASAASAAQDAPPAAREVPERGTAPAAERAPDAARFHDPAELPALLAAWLGTGLAQTVEIATSAGGRPLLGVQLGGRGPTPLAERTTVLLLGGLDGVSLAGSEAVIAVTEALLAAPGELPADVTFVAVPWANPDGLARQFRAGIGEGRNDRPVDDDHDGAVDEDGPDDMDGDGAILELLVPDPDGAWVRGADGRFLRRAREGEAPRYRRTREGRDEDGDGRFNEDGPGGVVLDRNFPVGWNGPWSDVSSGPWPLSEKESRALAEFALGRRIALALVFQGNHGRLAAPGGVDAAGAGLELPAPADLPSFRFATELFVRATGRAPAGLCTLREARGAEVGGTAVDWLYASRGVLALEVGVWGPAVEAELRETVDARFVREREAEDDAASEVDPDLAWQRWLDDTRGGMGFVDWQPVELGDGGQGLLGGWEPRTLANPPPEVLPRALAGLGAFTLELARALPRLEIDVREARRDGRVCIVRARVRNAGRLAAGVGPGAGGATLVLELEDGESLLAGEPRVALGALPGAGTSSEVSWLLAAPEGSVFRLRLECPWGEPVVREVRL